MDTRESDRTDLAGRPLYRVGIECAEGGKITFGSHMLIEGEVEAIKKWLVPFDGVWIGVGQPIEQRFEISHIAEEELECKDLPKQQT